MSLYTIEEEHSQEEEIDNDNPLSATPTHPKTSIPSPATPDSPFTYEAFRQLRASGHSPHALIAFILFIQHVPIAIIPFLVLGARIPFSDSSNVGALQGNWATKLITFVLLLCVTNANLGFWSEGLRESWVLAAVKTWVPDEEGEMSEDVRRITGGKERVEWVYSRYVLAAVLVDAVVALEFGRLVEWLFR
ncbi:hypothetical protein LZ554_002213 [Drepanopeziza brunnea f. sp. 'monogermtubi']|nr:hypothetical protein LZ554_002213 [Drepanopeziza brunnea f. sp. 'monogermtubi']